MQGIRGDFLALAWKKPSFSFKRYIDCMQDCLDVIHNFFVPETENAPSPPSRYTARSCDVAVLYQRRRNVPAQFPKGEGRRGHRPSRGIPRTSPPGCMETQNSLEAGALSSFKIQIFLACAATTLNCRVRTNCVP